MIKRDAKKVIIIGGGGHARVLYDILRMNSFSVMGYADRHPKEDFDLKYLGDDQAIVNKYDPQQVRLVNGVGSIKQPVQHQEIYERFRNLGYRFCAVVHSQSIVSSYAQYGEGTQIIGGCVINAGTVIEENVVINTSASVDHDCFIRAHSHIAPGVIISGAVKIGRGCHIGCGATIIQGVSIGDGVIVGAGTLVLKNIQSGRTVWGVPGKVYSINL